MAADYSQPAVRKADGTYCSPWCGMGCTFAAFEKATADAEALATQLGPNWEPHVWENMGWHYSAMHGEKLSLYPHSATDFAAYFNDDDRQYIGGGVTPALAVLDLRDKMEAALEAIRSAVMELP